jgi:hypothetical protein
MIHRNYRWKYKQQYFEYSHNWSESMLKHLESLPHDQDSDNFQYYVYNEPYRYELESFVDDLLEYGSEKIDFYYPSSILQYLLNFVQYLNYYEERGEYPRYPMETIIDKGGDCEDTAILMAYIANYLGYDCVFLLFNEHCDLGIANTVTYVREMSGSFWEHNGQKYYYVSCNGRDRKIGEYSGKWGNKAQIIEI